MTRLLQNDVLDFNWMMEGDYHEALIDTYRAYVYGHYIRFGMLCGTESLCCKKTTSGEG